MHIYIHLLILPGKVYGLAKKKNDLVILSFLDDSSHYELNETKFEKKPCVYVCEPKLVLTSTFSQKRLGQNKKLFDVSR